MVMLMFLFIGVMNALAMSIKNRLITFNKIFSCDKWKVSVKSITNTIVFIFVDHIAVGMLAADSWVDNIRRLDYCCFFIHSCFIVFNYQVN